MDYVRKKFPEMSGMGKEKRTVKCQGLTPFTRYVRKEIPYGKLR
jgi:hypothetical protein